MYEFVYVYIVCMCVVCVCIYEEEGVSLGWIGSESPLYSVRTKRSPSIYFSVTDRWTDMKVVGNWTLSPTEPSICSAINLPPLSLCPFTRTAIYPSSPVAKGWCLFVALIIWTNFLCNLFSSQPPTWSSSVRLLKVEPLIPASPFPPITLCFFSIPSLRSLLRSFVFWSFISVLQ